MKRIIILVISLLLFFISYQVRTGFLLSKDYNNPGDAREYSMAASAAVKTVRQIHSIDSFFKQLPVLFNSFDTHSAPVTIAYYTLIDLLTFDQDKISIVFSSLFIVFLFLVCRRLFSLWAAIVVALFAVVYTPLYSLIYSFMPERFGSFFVPIMIVLASYFALRAKFSVISAVITGVLLGLASLYRVEFRWIGVPFVFIWTFINLYENNFKKEYKRIIFYSLLMFSFYALFSVGWIFVSKIVNPDPYYKPTFVFHVLYNTYNYSLQGWNFDTAPVKGFSDFLNHFISQGPFHIAWLQLALVIRLWGRPATVYANEYVISDSLLFAIHYTIIALAIIGLRRVFSNKFLLFLFIPLAWASIFSYIPEDLRRQVPLVGLLLIFAGAGMSELARIFFNKKARVLFVYLAIGFLLLVMNREPLYGLLSYLYPGYTSILPLRIFIFLFTLFIFVKIVLILSRYDKKNKFLFRNHYINLIPSVIPLLAFLLLSWYNVRSHLWHEWTTRVKNNYVVKQTINLSSGQLAKIREMDGYLLVDLKDANIGKNLVITLNEKVVKDRFKVVETFSGIDLRVIRQFQRGMPRLGYGPVEESVQSLHMFPNMHYWLITKVAGELLENKNEIVIKNTASEEDSSPILYGDYFSASKSIFHGPTPLIFYGPGSFLKYEADGDIRLSLKRNILSVENSSELYVTDMKHVDLSDTFGIQTGRYRIFFLFPFPGGDPVNLF